MEGEKSWRGKAQKKDRVDGVAPLVDGGAGN